jgi:hypothetical protein
MSNQFADIRELIIVRGSAGGLSIATLLAVLTDSSANLFQPGTMEAIDRFKTFMKENYPWDIDPPFGLDPQDAIDLMWEVVRASAIHRLGLQPDPPFEVRYVVPFSTTDESMTEIELSDERPFSEPTIKFDGRNLTIQLKSWYWGLRRAVVKAVDSQSKVQSVTAHIQAGEFARTNGLFKLLKADVPRAKKKS